MVDWLRLFKDTATEIRQEVQPLFGSAKAKEEQGRGSGGNITRFIDTLAESIVVRNLQDNDVSCTLISEEKGTHRIGDGGGNDYVILDAIDGTTNALHRIPFSATSIAHASGHLLKDVDFGLIMELNSGTIFKAQKGKGAYEEGRAIKPSETIHLEDAVVSVELTFPKDFQGLVQHLTPVMSHISKFRQLGSTALECVYVASGALDAFVDLRGISRAVDLAAATLIVREAGGFIVKPNGDDLDMALGAEVRTQLVVAGNQPLLEEILRFIA